MQATKIQVLSIDHRSGKAKATGNDYSLFICQCVLFTEGEAPAIGELILPRDHPEVTPGMYDAEFGVAVDLQTKRIGGRLIRLTRASGVANEVARQTAAAMTSSAPAPKV